MGIDMKQDKYEINNALQDHKRRLRMTQISLELMENNYDELKAHRDKILEELNKKKDELEKKKEISDRWQDRWRGEVSRNGELTKNIDKLEEELERMKRIYEPKKSCKNCSGGCVASEINGKPCSPK